MGGQEGNRGYVLQSVIAAIDSLRQTDWEFVRIEPDSDNQKVDIDWTDVNGQVTVCQVKSSSNNFNKSVILKILNDLVTDVPDAKEYRLVLIGTFTADTTKYFRQLKKLTEDEFPAQFLHLYSIKENINIEMMALHVETLDSSLIEKVHAYLSVKGYIVGHPTVKLIAGGLSNQFSRFANDGRKVSKAEFEKQLLEWIEYNYPNKLIAKEVPLSLAFYLYDILPISESLSQPIPFPRLIDQSIYLEKIQLLQKLHHQIRSIKLTGPYEITYKKDPLQILAFKIAPTTPMEYGGMDAFDMESLSERCNNILGVTLEPEFFNVGNLKKSALALNLLGLQGKPNYHGTGDERRKQELLNEFNYELYEAQDLIQQWTKLEEYRIVPIILRNTGNSFQEGIDVQLRIPADVKFITDENFPYPDYTENIKFYAEENGLIENFLRHYKDSNVKEYDERRMMPIDTTFMVLPFGSENNTKRLYLEGLVKRWFDYEILSDLPGFTTIECSFSELKGKDNVAFPSYLLLKYDKPFEITYQIRSKQVALSSGTLKLDVSGKAIHH